MISLNRIGQTVTILGAQKKEFTPDINGFNGKDKTKAEKLLRTFDYYLGLNEVEEAVNLTTSDCKIKPHETDLQEWFNGVVLIVTARQTGYNVNTEEEAREVLQLPKAPAKADSPGKTEPKKVILERGEDPSGKLIKGNLYTYRDKFSASTKPVKLLDWGKGHSGLYSLTLENQGDSPWCFIYPIDTTLTLTLQEN